MKESGHPTPWPPLPYPNWSDTLDTLHLWTQIVGKIRLSQTPWINHSWHVAMYVTPNGLTTGIIPYQGRAFQIDFDFLRHRLVVDSSRGEHVTLDLRPMSVAHFHRLLMDKLGLLGVHVGIDRHPNEVENPVAFVDDAAHCAYDAEAVGRFHHAMLHAHELLTSFRARFCGKCSPVHFFWGGFDLAVTRFSGRPAPEHPGGMPNLPDRVTREAYSQEVCSAGFWPGGPAAPEPLFYSYAYPAPEGYAESTVLPEAAYFHPTLREFVLPYEAVRTSADPEGMVMDFLQSTYEVAADLGKWDRSALERLHLVS